MASPTMDDNTLEVILEENEQPLSFLDLTGEIRNKIYKLLLVQNRPVSINSHESDKALPPHRKVRSFLDNKPEDPESYGLGILSANKQVHQEAISILFEENTFRVSNGTREMDWGKPATLRALRFFLKQVPPKTVNLIRNVELMMLFPYTSFGYEPNAMHHTYTMAGGDGDGFYEICDLLQNNFGGLRNLTIMSSAYSKPGFLPRDHYRMDHWTVLGNEFHISTAIGKLLRARPKDKVRFYQHLQLTRPERERFRKMIFYESIAEEFAVTGDMGDKDMEKKAEDAEVTKETT